MTSPTVTALDDALAIVQSAFVSPEKTERAFDLARVTMLLAQVRDAVVQAEQDLKESIASGLAAHKQLLQHQTYHAEVQRTLGELAMRESIALTNHKDRVKLLGDLRGRDPWFANAVLSSTFVVSTDEPRPVVAGVSA